jgi:hypothetical protein
VSITIGGNDAGLTGVLSRCVLLGFLQVPCEQIIGPAGMRNVVDAGPKIAGVLAKIKDAAPEADVAILEYPDPFPSEPMSCPGLTHTGIQGMLGVRVPPGDIPYLRGLLAAINREVSAAAGAAGVTYAPLGSRFAGHDACSAQSWFGPITGWIETLHPNAPGNQAMKDALIEAIGLAD